MNTNSADSLDSMIVSIKEIAGGLKGAVQTTLVKSCIKLSGVNFWKTCCVLGIIVCELLCNEICLNHGWIKHT